MGMRVDVQTCWHDPTAHAQRFFLPKEQKQMTVTSLYDVIDILLVNVGEGIKGSTHETEGLSGAGSWFSSAVWLVPQLVHLGSHRTRQGSVLYLFNHTN